MEPIPILSHLWLIQILKNTKDYSPWSQTSFGPTLKIQWNVLCTQHWYHYTQYIRLCKSSMKTSKILTHPKFEKCKRLYYSPQSRFNMSSWVKFSSSSPPPGLPIPTNYTTISQLAPLSISTSNNVYGMLFHNSAEKIPMVHSLTQ